MGSFGGTYIFALLLFGCFGVQGDNSSFYDVCNKTNGNYYYCIDCLKKKHQNQEDLDYDGVSITCSSDSAL